MVTSDDKAFCLGVCSEDGLQASRLVYYMYIMQSLGYHTNFRFKLTSAGLCSSDLTSYLNDLLSMGSFNVQDGILSPSESNIWHTEVPLFATTIEITNEVKVLLDKLSIDDLELLCLSDLVITTVLKEKSPEALVKDRGRIKTTLINFCKNYTDEDFDACVSFMRDIRKKKEHIR